jgi:translocator protein
MKKFLKLLFAIAICEAVGIVGGLFTFSSIPTWYATLQKPSFSPPNWLFGPVWTALYAMMGIALFLAWEKKVRGRAQAIKVFNVQLALNLLWSILFFYFKSPLAAFNEIIVLWAAILITIILFYRLSKPAAYLMVPYLLWVSFAAFLNFSIYLLNPA